MNNLLKYLWGNITYYISYFFPKSNNIWIFGAWGGKEYADNPKYLFEFVTKQHPEINAIWLTRSKKVVNSLRKENKKVFLINSFMGLWYACRARVGITSHGMIDINRFACARIKIVQTWHGIPMKPVLLSDPKEGAIKKRKRLTRLSLIFPFLKKELEYHNNLVVCSSSMHVSNILKKVFGEDAPIKVLGFPRLDGLFKPQKNNSLTKDLINKKKEGATIGIYMPTYRKEGEFDIVSYFNSNNKEIESFLKSNNHYIYLKIHPYDYYKIQKYSFSNRIRIIDDKEINNDIYSILGLFDYLITDYSSVIFDFLILGKPTFLMVPDRESYVASNGDFVYDYRNLDLPTSNDWAGLLTKVSNKSVHPRMDSISKKYHQYTDGESSKRLFKYIKKNLK